MLKEILTPDAISKSYYFSVCNSYACQIKQKALDIISQLPENEVARKLLIHANNILDCLEIHKFFEIYISYDTYSIKEQPYFELVGKMNCWQLLQLINNKLYELSPGFMFATKISSN